MTYTKHHAVAAKEVIVKMAQFSGIDMQECARAIAAIEQVAARGDLRDHFAGLAMQALLTRRASADRDDDARRAYAVADAMLAAREMEE